jgi:hypothetical protein
MATAQKINLPSSSEELAALLKQNGYDTNPGGLARKDRSGYEISSNKETAFLDINADSVRRSGKVPKRPIRLTFYLAVHDGSVLWKLESVKELESGEETTCLDRNPGAPEEDAPWRP